MIGTMTSSIEEIDSKTRSPVDAQTVVRFTIYTYISPFFRISDFGLTVACPCATSPRNKKQLEHQSDFSTMTSKKKKKPNQSNQFNQFNQSTQLVSLVHLHFRPQSPGWRPGVFSVVEMLLRCHQEWSARCFAYASNIISRCNTETFISLP